MLERIFIGTIKTIEYLLYLFGAWFVFSTLEVMVHRFFDLGSTYTVINFWVILIKLFT